MTHLPSPFFVAFLAIGMSAAAQMPSMPSLGGLGRIPSMSGVSQGNAAGLLSYCGKNKLLGSSSGASSTLSTLTRKPGVTSSQDYAAGQAGKILSGKSPGLSLDSVPGPMKSQACDMVLKQAKHFLLHTWSRSCLLALRVANELMVWWASIGPVPRVHSPGTDRALMFSIPVLGSQSRSVGRKGCLGSGPLARDGGGGGDERSGILRTD